MPKLGKLETVEKEMADHGFRCLGLSEKRWTGKGHFVTDLGSTIIYSGVEEKKESGVAVMLDRIRTKSLLGYNPISDRILTVRLAAEPWNVTLIQVYALTNQVPESESNQFYSGLQQVVKGSPSQEVVVVTGDFNAKIGERAPIGKYGLGTRNENGEWLIDFATANRLIAANAITREHAQRKYTWRSFDGLHSNQIDYVLVQRRWQSTVAKFRTYPGADADLDHVLVGMKFNIKLKRLQQPKRRETYDFFQSEQYRLELLNHYTCLDTLEATDPSALSESADDEWQHLKRNILESAHSTMRKRVTPKKQPWMKPDTLDLIEEKRKCAKGSEKYGELKRTVRAKLRQDNLDHIDQICSEMEKCQRQHNTKDMFACMNRLTKQACPKVKLVQSEQGVQLTDDTEIKDRWRRYCENLYKAELDNNNSDSCPPRTGGTMEPTPSREEVERAIKALKDSTVAGPDEIPSELLKLGGDSVTSAPHRIIVKVWQTGK